MSTAAVAAALLAAALLAAPPPPLRRLTRTQCRVRLAKSSLSQPILGAILILAASALSILMSPAAAAAAGVAGATAVMRRRRRKRAGARRREGRALGEALETLVGELRVGAHPVRAFAVAASESDGATALALRTVASRARLGADVAAGLGAVAAASPVPAHWDRVAVCWNLAAEQGLPITALMRAAHRDVVARQRFADRTEAGLAGSRATATILAALPAVGVLLGQLVGAGPLAFLLHGGAGGWVLVIGVSLVCLGLAWSDRIVDRVLS